MNFPTRAAYLCTRTQIWGREEEITETAHLARLHQCCGWQASRGPVSREGGQTTSSPGPGSQRADCADRARRRKPQREGAAGRARTLPGSSHSPWPCRALRSVLAGGAGACMGERAGRREAAPGRRSPRAPPETRHGRPGLGARRGQRPSPPRPDARRARAPEPAVQFAQARRGWRRAPR